MFLYVTLKNLCF